MQLRKVLSAQAVTVHAEQKEQKITSVCAGNSNHRLMTLILKAIATVCCTTNLKIKEKQKWQN